MGERIFFEIVAADAFSAAFKKLKNQMGPIGKAVAIAGGAIAGTGTALFAMAKTTATAYDKIQKLSDQTGISTKALSELKVASNFTGSSFSNLVKGLEKLQTGIGEAAKGTGTAKDALADLGISIRDSNGALKSAETILPEVAEKMKGLTNAAERNELSSKLFSLRNFEMIKILKDGKEGLKGYAKEAEAMGLIVSKQAGANAAKFNDALYKVTGTLEGLKNAIGEKVMPVITGLAEIFQDFIKRNRAAIIEFGGKVINTMASMVERMAVGIGLIIDNWRNMQMTWEFLKIGLNELSKFFVKSIDFILEKTVSMMKALNFKGVFDSSIFVAEKWSSSLKSGIDSLQQGADKARESINEIATKGFASDAIENFIAKTKEAYAEIRARGDAHIEERIIQNETINAITEEQTTKEIEDLAAKLEELDSLYDEYYLTEGERLDKWYAKEQTKFKGNEEALLKLKKVYDAKDSKIKQDKAKEDKELRDKELQARLTFYNDLISMGRAFGQASFRIAQLAGIAKAWVNTSLAATEALAAPPGPPWSFAYVAAAYAAGAAQVANIVKQKYAHGGMTNVPKEQTLTVAGGERILSPNQNKDFTDFIQNGGGGGSVNIERIEIMPNATNAEALLYMQDNDWDEIIEAKVIPAMRRLSRAGVTV